MTVVSVMHCNLHLDRYTKLNSARSRMEQSSREVFAVIKIEHAVDDTNKDHCLEKSPLGPSALLQYAALDRRTPQ